jgi:hypothetical protein
MLDIRFAPSTKLIPQEILFESALRSLFEEMRTFVAIALDRGPVSEGHFAICSAMTLRSCGLVQFSPELKPTELQIFPEIPHVAFFEFHVDIRVTPECHHLSFKI